MRFSLLKVFVCLVLLFFVAITIGCKDEVAVVQVNDVISDPGAFTKRLSLEGIVYAYSEGDASIVGVMDKKELQCNSPNCNKNLIAVKVPGQRLAIGDEINALGSIIKQGGGYILKAEYVTVVTRHKLGA